MFAPMAIMLGEGFLGERRTRRCRADAGEISVIAHDIAHARLGRATFGGCLHREVASTTDLLAPMPAPMPKLV